MIIKPLADYKEELPKLAAWFLSEWEAYYGVDGPGDAQADLEARCNYKEIPIGLVAIEEGQVCGTVALDLDAATNLTPSMVGLLVAPTHRGRGIAATLLKSAEDLARTLGNGRVYMSTAVLGNLLERRGWAKLGEIEFMNTERGWIYVRDFDN